MTKEEIINRAYKVGFRKSPSHYWEFLSDNGEAIVPNKFHIDLGFSDKGIPATWTAYYTETNTLTIRLL